MSDDDLKMMIAALRGSVAASGTVLEIEAEAVGALGGAAANCAAALRERLVSISPPPSSRLTSATSSGAKPADYAGRTIRTFATLVPGPFSQRPLSPVPRETRGHERVIVAQDDGGRRDKLGFACPKVPETPKRELPRRHRRTCKVVEAES